MFFVKSPPPPVYKLLGSKLPSFGGLGQRTDKVDRWKNSDQKQRWVASALLDIEKGLNRIKGHRHLPRRKAVLKMTVNERESQKTRKAA